MTARQRVALANVAAHDHIHIPFLTDGQNGQNITKAEAYILIEMILDGVRPTTDYLDSLDRDDDVSYMCLQPLSTRPVTDC